MHARPALVAAFVAVAACATTTPAPVTDPNVVARLNLDGKRVRPLLQTQVAKGFVDAAPQLPAASEHYYFTKYGTPIAYARTIDLLAAEGLDGARGKRWLDIGYGSIGQLRLLALLGADSVGVDVDPKLRALYSAPTDQGPLGPGRVTLVHGNWPAQPHARAAVGDGFHVIVAKNVLKRGFIHPERPALPNRLIDLEVDDATYVKAVFDALKPSGWFLIYNLHPAPSAPGEPYKTWADGRSPFDRSTFEAAGFTVVALDRDDTHWARRMARALRWDAEGMAIDSDLFGTYTLLRRPSSSEY